MPTFKDYSMDQLQLPLSFENLIPENHLFRVVNTIVDSLDLALLYDRYKDGGCPAYHLPDDTKGLDLFLFPENILFPNDCQSSPGKYQLHVDRRRK